MPTIKPISDLRNYSAVLQDVAFGAPVYLTKNGRGCYAIVDIAEQEEYEKTKAALRLMCELEKGRKAAPSMEVMQKMVSKLALNKEESERFYDLAALEQTAKNPIPKDLNAFLKDNHVIVSALRTAKDLDATDEEWQDFIDKLRKSREGKP